MKGGSGTRARQCEGGRGRSELGHDLGPHPPGRTRRGQGHAGESLSAPSCSLPHICRPATCSASNLGEADGAPIGLEGQGVHGGRQAGARRDRARHALRTRVAEARLPRGLRLDGFPRTLPRPRRSTRLCRGRTTHVQVINLEVSDETIVTRRGRAPDLCRQVRQHPPPRVQAAAKEGVCDACGSASSTSATTTRPTSCASASTVYHEQTAPLTIDFYAREERCCRPVDGESDSRTPSSRRSLAASAVRREELA